MACQLFKEGKNIEEIAGRLQRDPAAVDHKLIEFGVIGFIDSEDRYTDRSYLEWSEQEKEQLNQEFKAGKTIEEIAKLHQRYRNAIFHRLIKHRQFDITDRSLLIKYSDRDIRTYSNGNPMVDNGNDEKEYGLKDKSNVDEPVRFAVRPEKVGIVDRFITKRSGAIFEKRQHEDKLNELWKEFDETIEKIKDWDKVIKKSRTDIPGLEKTLEVAKKEWTESLTDLGNLINKNTTHEIGMWDITQKSQRTKGLKVNQKFRDSDIDEIRFNNMMDYIKQYPELQTQKVIEKAIQEVDEKRNNIVGNNPTQKEIDTVKSTYNLALDNFEELVGDAEINLNEFEKEIKEAEEKVNNSTYNKSKFSTFGKTTYEIKATRLDLFPYKGKLELRKDKLKRFKDQLSEYKREPLVEINH